MAKGNATKLKKMKLVDGKAAPDVRINDKLDQFRSIDEMMGVKAQNPFGAHTPEEFEKKLDSEMNLADMQALAPRVGLIPIHDRTLLKKRLMDEFRKDYRKRVGYDLTDVIASKDLSLDEKAQRKVHSVLKEGR